MILVWRIKVPVSCTKTADYNLQYQILSLPVCLKKRHTFFLYSTASSRIVIHVSTKKRKNSPCQSSFFLSYQPVHDLSGIDVPLYLAFVQYHIYDKEKPPLLQDNLDKKFIEISFRLLYGFFPPGTPGLGRVSEG